MIENKETIILKNGMNTAAIRRIARNDRRLELDLESEAVDKQAPD